MWKTFWAHLGLLFEKWVWIESSKLIWNFILCEGLLYSNFRRISQIKQCEKKTNKQKTLNLQMKNNNNKNILQQYNQTNIKFIWKDIKDLTPVRGQDGKISDTQGKHLYWSPTRLSYPAGVWDFSVLPSYQCLILFLTNFPILYVFWCLILFLTKSLFCLHSSSVFPQNGFPLVKLIVDLSIYICALAVF